jgi:hypothetical protein
VTFYKHGNYRESAVDLCKQIWSWPVVGVIVPLVLGGGIAFMTSSHPWLADVFYLAGGILFIVKFLTWEDARQLDAAKRRNSYGLAIGLTLIVLCAAIWGNHRLNAPGQDAPRVVQSASGERPSETTVEKTPKAGATVRSEIAKDEKQQKQPTQGAEPSIPSSKSKPKSKGRAKQPSETVTGAVDIRQQSSGPNSPNIAQVGNNNQTIINPQAPEKNWVITDDICRKLLAAIRSTGSIKVSVGAFISDPDGANVVSQLDRCLPLVPGWNVTGAVLPPVPEAVTVATSSENEPIARTLRDGLQGIGFDANLRIIPSAPDIEVWIGKHAFKQQ